jgi:hypothetical protein
VADCPAGRSSPRTLVSPERRDRTARRPGRRDRPGGPGVDRRHGRPRRGRTSSTASGAAGRGAPRRAGWDAMSIGVDVPGARFEPAMELLAEVALRPTFPEAEVERLRDERLNDLLQARPILVAAPTRAVRRDDLTRQARRTTARRAAPARPVAGLNQPQLRAAYQRGLDPSRATLVVGGDSRDRRRRDRRASSSVRGDRGSVRPPPARLSPRAAVRERFRPRPPSARIGSRPRSGSATSAYRGASPTTTRCR